MEVLTWQLQQLQGKLKKIGMIQTGRLTLWMQRLLGKLFYTGTWETLLTTGNGTTARAQTLA
jgi:hypothetical protein